MLKLTHPLNGNTEDLRNGAAASLAEPDAASSGTAFQPSSPSWGSVYNGLPVRLQLLSPLEGEMPPAGGRGGYAACPFITRDPAVLRRCHPPLSARADISPSRGERGAAAKRRPNPPPASGALCVPWQRLPGGARVDLNLNGSGQAEEAGSDSGGSRFQPLRPRTLDGCRAFKTSSLT